jgi:hypothetical protein
MGHFCWWWFQIRDFCWWWTEPWSVIDWNSMSEPCILIGWSWILSSDWPGTDGQNWVNWTVSCDCSGTDGQIWVKLSELNCDVWLVRTWWLNPTSLPVGGWVPQVGWFEVCWVPQVGWLRSEYHKLAGLRSCEYHKLASWSRSTTSWQAEDDFVTTIKYNEKSMYVSTHDLCI